MYYCSFKKQGLFDMQLLRLQLLEKDISKLYYCIRFVLFVDTYKHFSQKLFSKDIYSSYISLSFLYNHSISFYTYVLVS